MLGLAAGQLLLPVAPAAAAPRAASAVDVIQVSGLIDPLMVDFIGHALGTARRDGSQVLVLQLDSPGAIVSDDELVGLAVRVHTSAVPVAIWVGTVGARAYGGAVELVRAAAVTGIAPRAHVGRFRGRPPPLAGPSPLFTSRRLSADEAKAAGAVDLVEPTLGDFVIALDGRRVGERTLSIPTAIVQRGAVRQRRPLVEVRFAKPAVVARVLHTVASPSVAYVLLVAGLLLVVFEFFTAGIGVAGVVGASCLVLAAFGLTVLPTRPLGLGLVVAGIAGLTIDLQAGAPRFWTAVGVVGLTVGSLRLYAHERVGWITLVIVVVGVTLFMVAAMSSVIRSRFSTPTIGRESMIGELGSAAAAVDPEGMVRVRGALWRARTNRATPIPAGQPIRVVAIDGLLLEVEPEAGGARDAGH